MSLQKWVEPLLLKGALAIIDRLHDNGHEAYFAGGAVRDLLLRKDITEIDIATSALPDEVEGLFAKTIPVGKAFGVVVVVEGSSNYEVTTFRKESEYRDGRHPSSVEFTDAQSDVQRRDFTVNALFLIPADEQVIDYVQGQEDLELRLIRTVGSPDHRFSEDKLRILRALRLACQLGFEIEEETYHQVQRFAPELTQVSWERIRDELLKILTGPDPSRGLNLLLDSGVLERILPEAAAMAGVEQPPQFHPEGDVFVHTCLMFELAGKLTDTLALGILLHDVGKPPTFTVKERIRFDGHVEQGARMAEDICRRLRISNDMTEPVVDLVKNHLRFIHVQEMRESTLKRFLRKENFDEHLELHRLDCLASHGNLSNYDFCKEKQEAFTLEQMRPKPLIKGQDLIDLGMKPGPVFSEILDALEDLQLEGHLTDKEESLDWVREKYLTS
ncbi:MAG: HD domain-containing protein [Acidobacteria bacterium]|nr:HD domain-containing protein [Acidobacteriota bacterium]